MSTGIYTDSLQSQNIPSVYMTSIQRCINIDATSRRCIDDKETLFTRNVPGGYIVAHSLLKLINSSYGNQVYKCTYIGSFFGITYFGAYNEQLRCSTNQTAERQKQTDNTLMT